MNAAYLREALDLARQGRGQASPNPMVGAVLVRDGRVVGRGFHTYAGLRHAEILAIEQAGDQARGATLYINLEPCSHQGRTAPCAEAIAYELKCIPGASSPFANACLRIARASSSRFSPR